MLFYCYNAGTKYTCNVFIGSKILNYITPVHMLCVDWIKNTKYTCIVINTDSRSWEYMYYSGSRSSAQVVWSGEPTANTGASPVHKWIDNTSVTVYCLTHSHVHVSLNQLQQVPRALKRTETQNSLVYKFFLGTVSVEIVMQAYHNICTVLHECSSNWYTLCLAVLSKPQNTQGLKVRTLTSFCK